MKSIIALCGLGGHAFGSFNERSSDHMWLRDNLPVDFPEARVLTYGYDTKLENSRSIQDLEAIAGTFRTALKIARPKNSVGVILVPRVFRELRTKHTCSFRSCIKSQ